MSGNEAAISKAIGEALKAIGIESWRTQSGIVKVRGGYMHLAPAGTPDRIGYLPDGRLFGLEVKDPKGKTDPKRAALQLAWRQRALAAGCVAAQVSSVDEAVAVVQRAMRRRVA